MKKSIALVMALLLTMTVFTGCGKEKKPASSATTTSLIWYLPTNVQPDAEVMAAEFNKKLKEKANMEVKFNFVDFGAYEQRMNMAISANEKYDLCFTTGNWLNKYSMNAEKGAYAPLNKLIDENAPELRKILPQFLFDNIKYKNDVYAIPNYQLAYNSYGVYLQKDLVDKYNFDASKVEQGKSVETLKQIEPFLEAVAKNEKDLYPFQVNYNLDHDYYGSDNKYYANVLSSPIMVNTDGKFTAILADDVPGSDSCNDLFNQWFKKGYIRKDHLSVMNDSQDVTNLKYAALPMVSKPGNLESIEAKYGTKFVEIKLDPEIVDCNSGTTAMTAVSTTSENKEAAVKFLGLINTDKELFNILCYGIEGTHYTKINESTVKPVENSKYSPSTDFVFGNQFNAYKVEGQPENVWEETIKKNESAIKSPLIGFIFDGGTVKTQMSQLLSINKEYKDIWAYDNYEELKAKRKQKRIDAGSEAVVAEVQKQLDAWKK